MRRWSRLGLLAIATAVVTVGTMFDLASPAGASTEPITITGNVNIRSGPGTNYVALTVMPKGSRPDYVCYTHGEDIGGTDIWFRVRFNSAEGYYTSYWDDVPLDAQSNLEGNYGIHYCGTGVEMNQMPGGNATIQVPTGGAPYDRNAATSWALVHATDTQPVTWSACAWFVSQALWAGGFLPTETWNGEGQHGTVRKVPGTVTATAAPDLVAYLQSMGWVTTISLDLRNNAIPEAQPGDIIAYEWDGHVVDHVALVVDIAPGSYPEVSEWGTNSLWQRRVGYQKRGWTWSEKDHQWLQVSYPKVTALLLHVNS